MNKAGVAAISAIVLAAGVVAFLALDDSGTPQRVDPAPSSCGQNNGSATEEAVLPEAAADAKMLELDRPADRINHLAWIEQQSWARSSLPVLRKSIVGDPSEEVQLAALETALRLAGREGAAATSNVVKTSLASTKGNTRARGLKAARENPDAELVPTLIELVDNRDAYATMALNALAYTPSPEGHAKILAIAEDESADRKLRERAIALLAITKDREALGLLTELANGEDEALRRIAAEVLMVINDSQGKPD
jgi:HEAT repeat protein